MLVDVLVEILDDLFLPLGEAHHCSLSPEVDVGERKANCNRNPAAAPPFGFATLRDVGLAGALGVVNVLLTLAAVLVYLNVVRWREAEA